VLVFVRFDVFMAVMIPIETSVLQHHVIVWKVGPRVSAKQATSILRAEYSRQMKASSKTFITTTHMRQRSIITQISSQCQKMHLINGEIYLVWDMVFEQLSK
jgi:hypothetical protein